MIWKITCIILALLVVGAGIGAYFYGQQQYNAGEKAGYENGLSVGRKESAERTTRKPYYAEMMDFLKEDQTEKNTYAAQYPSLCYMVDAYCSARNKGLAVKPVTVTLKERHTYLLLFETVDQGLFFIEPSLGRPVSLEKNKSYSTINEWKKPDYDDTIVEIYF